MATDSFSFVAGTGEVNKMQTFPERSRCYRCTLDGANVRKVPRKLRIEVNFVSLDLEVRQLLPFHWQQTYILQALAPLAPHDLTQPNTAIERRLGVQD